MPEPEPSQQPSAETVRSQWRQLLTLIADRITRRLRSEQPQQIAVANEQTRPTRLKSRL